MFVVRKAQLDAMGAARMEAFERRMIAAAQENFPVLCRTLGIEGTLAFIRYGIARAQRHAITTERDLSKYITLVFAFGEDFDTDPKFPWAQAVLNDPTLDGTKRTARLYAAAKASLRSPKAHENQENG